MSSNSEEETETGITDDRLPDDLVPSEDNPLAEGLDDGESAGDLLEEGKGAEGDQVDEGGERDEDDSQDSDESED